MNDPELKLVEVYTPTCANCYYAERYSAGECHKYDICSPIKTNKHHIFVEVKDETDNCI